MSPPLILITRPVEGAAPLASALEARGLATLIEPMLHLHSMPQHAMPILEGAMGHKLQATIITSRYALPALLPYTELRNLTLFVVGAATADAAMRHGFSQIIQAPDVHLLLRRILSLCRPEAGALLYARGRHVAFNMGATLNRQGFTIEEAIVYHMSATKALSPELHTALSTHTLHSATFMSAHTAEVFLKLIHDTPFAASLAHVRAVAFSPQVASVLAATPWIRLLTCDHPTLECMLDTVDKSVAEG